MSLVLSVLNSKLSKVCRSMADRWSWIRLCSKCERVFATYGGGGDEIPKDQSDPLEVFDETDVENNVMRFVVYIMWLKGQPDSFEKYLRVRDSRYDLWRSSVYKLWLLWKRRSSLPVRCWPGIATPSNPVVWVAWPVLPRPMGSRSKERVRSWNEIWATRCINRNGVVSPRRPWSFLASTNSGRRIWSKWSILPSTIGAIDTFWRWWMCFRNTPGCNPWRTRRVAPWRMPLRRSWKGDESRSIFRRTMARNFTTRPSKPWWKRKTFITFRPVATPKPVSWNGSIAPWSNACIVTSPWRTPWTLSRSCKISCAVTIDRSTAVSREPRLKSRWPTPPKCGKPFMARKRQNGRNPSSKWATVWGSTRSSGSSRKGICPVGRKKSLWWEGCEKVKCLRIKWRNGMVHRSKVHFTRKICRRWRWRTTTYLGSTRSSNAKAIKCWCAGKVGQTSTILGWTRRTCLQSHEGSLRAIEQQRVCGGVPIEWSEPFQEPVALSARVPRNGVESGVEWHLVTTVHAYTSNDQTNELDQSFSVPVLMVCRVEPFRSMGQPTDCGNQRIRFDLTPQEWNGVDEWDTPPVFGVVWRSSRGRRHLRGG